MTVFIDTSALYAVLDAADSNFERARRVWQDLVTGGETLLCSNYVLVECMALIQSRLGMEAVKTFQEDVVPVLTVHWVDEPLHGAAATALLIADRRRLSLVDCVSFDLMRRLGLKSAFVFDRHFAEQGFHCLP